MTIQLLRSETLMQRHPENPLIRPSDLGNADAVFNCGQTVYQGQTLLLLPVCPRGGTPVMYIARSSDGVRFDIDPEPFITPVDDARWREFDVWCIDPRITRIEDTYYISRPIETPVGTATLLEKTRDWKKRECVDCIAMPCNRVPSLFPERINGLYYRLDRPYTGAGQPSRGEIWLSSSPDLIHWGHHRRILGAGCSFWANEKVGPTPPIRTEAGWLVVIHGVLTTVAGTRYCLGAMLLDLKDPSKLIGLSHDWILCPDAAYEFMGNTPNVVFSCGAIADVAEDRLRIYYGAADTCICLATGKLSAVIEECLASSNNRAEGRCR